MMHHILVGAKETKDGWEIRGVEPKLRNFSVRNPYRDEEAVIGAVIGEHLQPKGVRAAVCFYFWPLEAPPLVDIQKVRELLDDPEIKLLTDEELEQKLREKEKAWAERFASWRPDETDAL